MKALTHYVVSGIAIAVIAGCQTADVTQQQTKPLPVTVYSEAQTSLIPEPTQVVDLAIAFRLAGVSNPTIGLAQERIQEALAGETAARALLLPSINIGGNYRNHDGALQSGSGRIEQVQSQSIALGAGAGIIGAGTAAFPGVRLFANLGDAVYEPLATSQRVSAIQSDAQAVNNSILRTVAVAYLDLVGAEARLEILHQGERDIAEVVRLTRIYAEQGQGRAADANRAKANADLLQRTLYQAEEEYAVASARLCRLLNLDPSIRLCTPGGPVEMLRLIEETDEAALQTLALKSRPEIFARSAEILEARTRVRQEKARPWMPTLSAGYSGTAFGGGRDSDFSPLASRGDFDVAAVWTLENFTLGNRSRILRARSIVGQSMAELDNVINLIRREVSTALAETNAAARQIEVARNSVQIAEEGFRLEETRIRQGQGLPIEVLDSFRQLLDARQELLRAIIRFNQAQFQLDQAIGNTPK